MTSQSPPPSQNLPPGEVFSPAELRALAARIRESGELGRSRTYASLLDFLVECSISGRQPKEIEIAMDVLGRQPDFDVSRDSSVRVYIHQLRKKLDSFYRQHESGAAHRILIPKGQYTIAAEPRPAATATTTPRHAPARWNLRTALLVTAVLLLVANLVVVLERDDQAAANSGLPVVQNPLWQPLFDDDFPILIVMGDYYIFGELNDTGNVARMIREFDVNSSRDLESRIFSELPLESNYLDLDLSYIPEGSAYALTRTVPLLVSTGKRINITMMSDLTTQDIRSNHIVYIGYISALDKLSDMVFAASGLRVGRSYDELQNLETGSYYTSDAGLPEAGQQFRDYGMFASFPASGETQLVVVAGMRDAGLMHTSLVVSEADSLEQLEQSLPAGTGSDQASAEALFEVFGVDRMNFTGNLVYSRRTDPAVIWNPQISSYGN